MATYSVQMTDSETPASWMSLPGVVAKPANQGGGKVRMTVTTQDPDALVAALDADDDVLSYDVVEA